MRSSDARPNTEKGPAGLAPGEATAPTKGTEMNTSIIAQPTDIHPDIKEILDRMPAESRITGGDLHEDSVDEKVIPLSAFANPDDVALGITEKSFGRLYTFAGERIRGREVPGIPQGVMYTPNAVHVLEDGVFVSDGMFVAWEWTTLDGAAAVRLISMEKFLHLSRDAEKAAEEAFLNDHPEIMAAKPAWADRVEVFGFDYDGPKEVTFSRDNAAVFGVYDEDTFKITDPRPSFRFEFEGVGVAEARAAIAAFQAAIDATTSTERP